MQSIEDNDYEMPSSIKKGIGKTTKIGCLLFTIFIVIAVGIFIVVAFFNSLFDRNRIVGTHYTMSSGVTGSARAIEFPFAIRGNTIRSISISSEVNTDFYIRTKSGTELVIYKNKVVEKYLKDYEASKSYALGLKVKDSDGRIAGKLFDPGKQILSPSSIHIYTLG